ncbi:adenosine kinase [Pelagibius litoralis]|uniref:Adenosine kinase n=1 Tax=Pelagibius litoralis TaxID=374515 RepID=A0A967F315_9PROT|nr:adenosine kinase [Pelagibius litoralis]NIA71980.1 adenosine kinase [Pelagibius litoralis]
MTAPQFDVVAIGNALVDVLSKTDDAFLEAHQINKGSMTLIDEARAVELYDAMGPAVEVSGGSAGNTAAGVASLGGKAVFLGKVRDDQLGAIFTHDIRATGVGFDTPHAASGPATGRSMILVTPDAARSMNTFLGAAVDFGPDDVDAARVEAAAVTYMEGYLWDSPSAKAAFLRAAGLAHAAGRKVSLTLSDPFLVDRYKDELRDFVAKHVDIVFANEEEVCGLFDAPDFDGALQQVRRHCDVAALTRSEKGAVIVSGDEVHVVDAVPVANVVDTTGAGDLFAAGFLYGITNGHSLYDSGRIGAIAAAEVISHVGARPEQKLAELIAAELGAAQAKRA